MGDFNVQDFLVGLATGASEGYVKHKTAGAKRKREKATLEEQRRYDQKLLEEERAFKRATASQQQEASLYNTMMGKGMYGFEEKPVMGFRPGSGEHNPMMGMAGAMGGGGPTGPQGMQQVGTRMSLEPQVTRGAGGMTEKNLQDLAMKFAAQSSDIFKDPEAYNQAYRGQLEKLRTLQNVQGLKDRGGIGGAGGMGGAGQTYTEGGASFNRKDVSDDMMFLQGLPPQEREMVVRKMIEENPEYGQYIMQMLLQIDKQQHPDMGQFQGAPQPGRNAVNAPGQGEMLRDQNMNWQQRLQNMR